MTARNGNTSDDVHFPLDSFKDAAPHLRRPFTAAAIKFKVQATWPKQQPTGGLIVCYIDARLAVERLNLIVPHLWSDHYEPTASGMMWCHLTVDGITRSDVGSDQQGKGLVSDALKRAAVKFGVGVSLYAVPKMILNVSDGHLKPRRDSVELTPNGETNVRNLYAAWLDTIGKEAFGEPLSHGDSEGAQGDIEADAPPVPTTNGGDASDVTPEPRRLNATQRNRVLSAIADLDQDEAMLFAAVGVSSADELTVDTAKKIRELLDKAQAAAA